ncbi:MAG TPA: queuosine precursor transporter [Alphaproteobacteria bacterium]
MTLKITSADAQWQPKYFAVITGLFCGLYMISSALVSKMIDVHGVVTSAAIIIFPICAIITDILTEVYGFNRARQAIWTVLACTILFAIFTQIAIILPPAGFWPHQDGFAAIFASTYRIALAACAAWIVGEFSNSFVVSKMKIFQNARHMAVRFISSTVVGQFLDTIVFFTIAFAGTMSWKNLFWTMLSSWVLKVAYEIVALPLSVPITNLVKKWEGIEHFDRQELHIV